MKPANSPASRAGLGSRLIGPKLVSYTVEFPSYDNTLDKSKKNSEIKEGENKA